MKSKVGNILAKAAALRITLNIDESPISSKSHSPITLTNLSFINLVMSEHKHILLRIVRKEKGRIVTDPDTSAREKTGLRNPCPSISPRFLFLRLRVFIHPWTMSVTKSGDIGGLGDPS